MNDSETLALWIQTFAVLVAVGASGVALIVSWRDRVNSRRIAAEDRRSNLEQAKLMMDLQMLIRLLQNQNLGGVTDSEQARVMGAEELTLIGYLGRDLIPRQWDRRVGKTSEGFAAYVADESEPEYLRDAVEVQMAVDKTVARIRELTQSRSTD